MNKDYFATQFIIPTVIASVALIIGLWILGISIANRGSDSTIAVTGSASVNIKADTATWDINVQRTAGVGYTADAYTQVAKDGSVVKSYLESQNLASSSVSESVISTDQNYQQDQNAPVTYNVHETITIQTTSVDDIDALSRKLDAISSKVSPGTILMPQAPQYYVSSLPDLRVKLAGKAVEDAKARAIEIAKSGVSSVGALKGASAGVLQVLSPNSTKVDDYGSYDTATIQKHVRVTAHATVYVR